MNTKTLSSRLADEPGLILFVSPKILNKFIQKGFSEHIDLDQTPVILGSIGPPLFGKFKSGLKYSLEINNIYYSVQRGLSLLIDGEIDDNFSKEKLKKSYMPIMFNENIVYGVEIRNSNDEIRKELKTLLKIKTKDNDLANEDNPFNSEIDLLEILQQQLAPDKSYPLWPLFEPSKYTINLLIDIYGDHFVNDSVKTNTDCYLEVGEFSDNSFNKKSGIYYDGNVGSLLRKGVEIINDGYMPVNIEINPHGHRHKILFRSFYRNDSLVRDFLKSYACDKSLEGKLSKTKPHPTIFEIQQAIGNLYNK